MSSLRQVTPAQKPVVSLDEMKVFLRTDDLPALKSQLLVGSGDAKIFFQAVEAGSGGDAISITIVDPEDDGELGIEVTGDAIEITLEKVSSALISTAQEVIDAVLDDPDASEIVTATVSNGDGTGVVAALEETSLAGGRSSLYTIEDALIEGFIGSMTGRAEHYTNRALLTQTWEEYFDHFPCFAKDSNGKRFKLSRGTVSHINEITYLDADGETVTLSESTFISVLSSEPARIVLSDGESWPTTQRIVNAVRVEFICGYGDDAEDVPLDLKLWIMRAVGFLYENRQAQDVPESMLNELWNFVIPV